MKNRVFVFFLALAVFTSQVNYEASADSSRTWNYSDQYITSNFEIKQENGLSGENFSEGEANLTISISKLEPEFKYFVDSNQDTYSDNSVNSSKPDYLRVSPDFPSEKGELFIASADIWISDHPDFDVTKSKTYFAASINMALGPTGKVLEDHPITNILIHDIKNLYKIENGDYEDNCESDARIETFLKKTVRGYIFELPSFSINSNGILYVHTKTDLFQKWKLSNPEIRGSSSIAYNYNAASVVVKKLSKQIAFKAPTFVQLKNRIARLSFESSSELPVNSREVDSSVCIIDGDLIYPISPGVCEITLNQIGNEFFEPAPEVRFTTLIVAEEPKKSITCIKGKVIKKVTSSNPKCPAGYKKK